MRALASLRNHALFVFFLLLVGGVVLNPGRSERAAQYAGPAQASLPRSG